jgi:hypothetical protein
MIGNVSIVAIHWAINRFSSAAFGFAPYAIPRFPLGQRFGIMSKSTISTFELFALIPDAETARKYLEARLWPEGPRCPCCGLGERITARKDGLPAVERCAIDEALAAALIVPEWPEKKHEYWKLA